MLIDTHAHIHQAAFDPDRAKVLERARAAEVGQIVCVATDGHDSQLALKLAQQHANVRATVGLHPHHAQSAPAALQQIKSLAADPKVVAIGECGLDYFYHHSPRTEQLAAFKFQLELAQAVQKPVVFHVRAAFDDFFKTVDNYQNLAGVVHCFSADTATMNQALNRGFYVAFNGIMTFTKDESQLAAARACPVDRMLLETDCPFLTPSPKRGQRNEPANLKLITEFLANLRNESFTELASATTQNARTLFGI